MTTHKRSDHITAISVSIPKDLLALVDKRAHSLGLNRSQYLAQLVRGDIVEGGPLTIHEGANAPKATGTDAPSNVGGRAVTKYPPLPTVGRSGKTAA